MTITTAEQSESPAVVWDDLIRTLKHSKLLIIVVLLSTMAAAFVSLQFVSWQYEAKAKLLVKLGRENTEIPATVEKGDVFTTGVRMEDIFSEIQLITSRPLIIAMVDAIGYESFMHKPVPPETLLQAIKYYLKLMKRWLKDFIEDTLITFGLQQSFTDREKVIMAISKYLTVTREKDSDVISLALRLPDPELATRALTSLLDIYLDRRIDLRRDINIRTFFDNRAQEHKNRLARMELAQESLRGKWDISSIEEQRKLLLERKHDLFSKIDENNKERALIVRGAGKAGIDQGVNAADVSKNIPADASVELIKERITNLRMEKIRLVDIYTPDSKPIRKINTEIGMLVNMVIRGLDVETRKLQSQIESIEKRLHALNTGEDELRNLERERILLEQQYLSYAERRENALISEEFDMRRVSNISVLSPPVRPVKPVYPRKTLIMALSFFIGLMAGTGLALLREYLKDCIRTQRDLAAITGLACLGTFDISAREGMGPR